MFVFCFCLVFSGHVEKYPVNENRQDFLQEWKIQLENYKSQFQAMMADMFSGYRANGFDDEPVKLKFVRLF